MSTSATLPSHTLGKIIKYQLLDVLRSRTVIVYGVFFLLTTESLLRFGGDTSKAILSILNVVLILVPLASAMFGTLYLFNAREFIELLLSQPIHRRSIFFGMYFGIVIPFMIAFGVGCGLPFLIHSGANSPVFVMLLLSGLGLTAVFIAFACWISARIQDKTAGIGFAFALWLIFSIVYDGLMLLVTTTFSDYPLEVPLLAMSVFNPIDLARILVMLTFDTAALLGYTGAVFESFFGTAIGVIISTSSLLFWVALPLFDGARLFSKRDF